MTNRVQKSITYFIAGVLCVQSFVLWSGIVSGSVFQMRSYVLEDRGEVLEQTAIKGAAPDVFLVPTATEPEVREPQKALKKVSERRQAQRELEQWGIKRWFTLSIPSVDVRAPVFLPNSEYWDAKKWDSLEEQMQVALLRGAAAYPHSVNPGKQGSIFIAGHSSPPNERAEASDNGRLFKLLPDLKRGDTISLAQGNSQVSYKVIGSEVVKPEQTKILAQQDRHSLLKLITCYPVGSTKERLVVTAVKQAN